MGIIGRRRKFPKWGVVLNGDEIELRNLWYKLAPAVRPNGRFQILRPHGWFVLAAHEWNGVQAYEEIRELAASALKLLGALLMFADYAAPVKPGACLLFRRNGEIKTQFASTEPFTIYVRRPEPEWMNATDYSRMLLSVSKRRYLQDAVCDYYGERDWIKLYRVIEWLMLMYGSEEALVSKGFVPKGDLLRVKRTANSYRHADGLFAAIKNPVSFNHATELVGELIKGAIMEATLEDDGTPIILS